MKTFIQTAKVLLIAGLVITAVSYAQAEWNSPTESPTGGNTPAPLNTTNVSQMKTGDLGSLATVSADQFCLIIGTDENGDPELECLDTDWSGGGSGTTQSTQKEFNSLPSIPFNSWASFSHGLSETPDIVQLMWSPKNNTGGYDSNNWYSWSTLGTDTWGTNDWTYGVPYYFDSSSVKVYINAGGNSNPLCAMSTSSSGGRVCFGSNDLKIKVTAIKL